MSEVDPLIFEFQARVNGYLSDLRSTTTSVDKMLGLQEARYKHLEGEISRSSGEISSHIKGLASGFAAYFSGRELVGLLDGFTRLQNNLRVAGVAGDQMKEVQDRLFTSAQKYGVELEGLSSLFSTLTQASKELGATQQQIFGITDAVSASLKIQGSSAEEAQGALLQLGQALRGGKIQAEEYNSLLDGMFPLLEAAAAGSTRWGGSVAKLTADVKKGTVTSQEFFTAILDGSKILEDRAAKASLTLSAGFTTLNNALTVYFGEADKANGVSAALGTAMSKIADNLDTLIPALAVISGIIVARYAAGLAVATAATIAKAAADERATQTAAAHAAMQARLNSVMLGTSVSAEAAAASVTSLSVASGLASRAGTGLLGVFGGSLGLAVTALTVAVGYFVVKSAEASAASEELARKAEESQGKLERLVSKLDKAGIKTEDLTRAAQAAVPGIDSAAAAYDRAAKAAERLAEKSGLAAIKMAQMRIVEEQERQRDLKSQLDRAGTSRGGASPALVIFRGRTTRFKLLKARFRPQNRRKRGSARSSLAFLEPLRMVYPLRIRQRQPRQLLAKRKG
ncbi:tape measure protein [Novosphingobium sp. EMRT-2]|uniref:tape measure protein n=1 Tax=Novosphingobium sp. EMRT-2 TaxID=2571749 RepID=UPI0010BDD4D0|nr:tape measure protein [Novosphingobium sp. EMRT-2]QCI95166.1 hypothetical protein FA702_17735 [Novosphingobium sp. EMRT-2]